MPYPEMQRPLFFSGKVMMDDGTPPPDSVTIEALCGGVARPQAYTDSKGRFSFEYGRNSLVMADASTSGAGGYGGGGGGYGAGMGNQRGTMGGNNTMGPMGGGALGERTLANCELRANLPGFRSDVVNLAGHRSMDNPDVGTIVLHRLGNVEGTTISATSLAAPKDAKKAFDKGRDALKKHKTADAEKNFQKAVDIYPKYAVAWYQLGVLQDQNKQPDEARKSFEQALAADSKYISPYMHLAMMAARNNDWKGVADTTGRALRLNPFMPMAYFYNSVANYNLNNKDAAEKSVREAVKLDTGHQIPKANQLLGVILADKQDFTGAADELRTYLKFAPDAQDADKVKTQLEQFDKLAKK